MPSKSGPAPGAAADGLVVLVAIVAEGEVVHRALRRGQHPERAVQRVGDALRGLDVAGDHRGGVARVQHAALRNDDLDRLETALVHRDRLVDQGAEHVQHRGAADRRRRVEIVGELRARAGEIDHGAARLPIDAHPHADHRAIVERILEGAVLERPEHPAHRFLGVVLYVPRVGQHRIQSELADHPQQLARPPGARGDLGLQVGHVLARVARRISARRRAAHPAPRARNRPWSTS